MREIKFRYYQAPGDGESGFNVITFTLDDLESGTIDRLILWQKKRYRIVGVAQYTGLKDKNGKEIYEGDIVELNVEIHKVPKELNRHVVVFRKGAFVCSENGFYFWDYAEGVNDDTVEVIGNIFENPELLEK